MTKVYEVDPVSRIEGHLGIKVTATDAGVVTEANAHGNLWRGFENFLVGRRVNDAITFTQRICGVCPVPHGTAATLAADSVLGVSDGYATFDNSGGKKGVPPAALLVRNLVLASEFLMSSITHFYHLVAQDYVQGPPMPPWTPYFHDDQYSPYLLSAGHMGEDGLPQFETGGPKNLWSAVITQYVKALRIRRLTFEASAMLAGRAPMMSMSIAGGTTNFFRSQHEFQAKLQVFYNLMAEVGEFVISEYIPLAFALGALYPSYDNTANAGADAGWGAGVGNFLAWGAFPNTAASGDDLAIKGGWVLKDGTISGDSSGSLLTGRANVATAIASVKKNLLEYIPRSRYAEYGTEFTSGHEYPGDVTRTVPDRGKDAEHTGSYSWIKAPRWGGHPMEVGPLARMVVNGMYVTSGKLFDPYMVDSTVTFPLAGTTEAPNADFWPQAYAWLYLNDAGDGLNGSVIESGLLHALHNETLGADKLDSVVTGYLAGLQGGLSTMDRIRARAVESFHMVRLIMGLPTGKTGLAFNDLGSTGNGWLGELYREWSGEDAPDFAVDVNPPAGTVSGFGLTEAPRGALGHFTTCSNGNILSYQCVVPTTWNASPKDGPDGTSAANGLAVFPANNGLTKRGPMEQAVCGVTFDASKTIAIENGDPGSEGVITSALSGVEVLRVAHTFDPCIACAIH